VSSETLLRRFNFSGIFLHHIVALPSGNSPTKNHEDMKIVQGTDVKSVQIKIKNAKNVTKK